MFHNTVTVIIVFLLAEFVFSNLRMDSLARRIKALEKKEATDAP